MLFYFIRTVRRRWPRLRESSYKRVHSVQIIDDNISFVMVMRLLCPVHWYLVRQWRRRYDIHGSLEHIRYHDSVQQHCTKTDFDQLKAEAMVFKELRIGKRRKEENICWRKARTSSKTADRREKNIPSSMMYDIYGKKRQVTYWMKMYTPSDLPFRMIERLLHCGVNRSVIDVIRVGTRLNRRPIYLVVPST